MSVIEREAAPIAARPKAAIEAEKIAVNDGMEIASAPVEIATDREAAFALLAARAPEDAHSFLWRMLAELDAEKVALKVSSAAQVWSEDEGAEGPGGIGCAGYFESDPPAFAMAVGKPFDDWFLVALHEFCHFRQWQENPEGFGRACVDVDQLFTWVAGDVELGPEAIERLARVARDLEHDCERRALASLEGFGLSELIDAQAYAQKANSYFNFYNYVAKNRVWYAGGREPYSLPEVWRSFPQELVLENGMTPEREALFARCAEA